MSDARKRSRNNGLRKLCDCGRRGWAKCEHDWHFNFTWKKKAYRFSLDRHVGRPLTGKIEAEGFADQIRSDIRHSRFGNTAPQLETLTLRQLVAEYGTRCKPLEDRHSIEVLYAICVPRLNGGELAFGDWLVTDITTDTIERFREIRSAQRMVTREGEKTERPSGGVVAANRHLAFLRAVFNWAIRVGHLEKTPFKRGTETVVKLKAETRRRRRLEPGEQERLFAQCAPHLRLVVEAALETGCRVGELLSLQWRQVRFDPKADVFLPAQKTKTKRDRRIPMSTRLKLQLELARDKAIVDQGFTEHEDPRAAIADTYVFGNTVGQRIQSIDHAFSAACRRAKIDGLHFHDLRREAGSRWLEGGVPLQVVRDWLGHANVSQTSTYLATTSEGEYEAMRRFDALQKSVASDCIGGSDKAPQSAPTSTDTRQETPIIISATAKDEETGEPFNQRAAGSIPARVTKKKPQ